MPTAETSPASDSILKLVDSLEIPMNSPIPRLAHWFALNLTPRYRAARSTRDWLLKNRLRTAWERFHESAKTETRVKSAIDFIVQREVMLAKKEGRRPQYDTQDTRDELFGFLNAGHETSSTAITWGLKFLTDHEEVQQKLRSALRSTFKRSAEVREIPSVQEITKARIPYLDAMVEEINRCGGTVSTNIRNTKCDTTVLGHCIPAGTDVFMMTNGPGFMAAPLPVDESKRSASSREWKDKNGIWDLSDIGHFKPERWLKIEEKDNTVFDSKAGPALPFGAGIRGCFGKYRLLGCAPCTRFLLLLIDFLTGKKMAYLELRIVLVLIIWNFELLPTPPLLSTYRAIDKITH